MAAELIGKKYVIVEVPEGVIKPEGTLPNQYEYRHLVHVLVQAFLQASAGKGKERHVFNDAPFREQQIFEIAEKVGIGFCTGQAVKKLYEQHASREDKVRDLLGAMVYTSAAVIILQEEIEKEKEEKRHVISSD